MNNHIAAFNAVVNQAFRTILGHKKNGRNINLVRKFKISKLTVVKGTPWNLASISGTLLITVISRRAIRVLACRNKPIALKYAHIIIGIFKLDMEGHIFGMG